MESMIQYTRLRIILFDIMNWSSVYKSFVTSSSVAEIVVNGFLQVRVGLVNIVTGKILNTPNINVDESIQVGIFHMEKKKFQHSPWWFLFSN